MFQRLKQYLTALLVLSALCAVYQLTFVAWLKPEPLPPLQFATTPALRTNGSLESLFPPGAWQLGNCKRLQTRDGALLFENWSQIGDDQWKLWPITVVLGLESDSPLILDAQEGAEIKFSESLDVMSGGAPPIERGRMIGQVRIRTVGKGFPNANGDEAAPAEQLEILSSDFGIDYRKIWTTQPIIVRLGDLRLEGRDLTLHLAPMGGFKPGNEDGLSILNRMELIYLDQLVVPLPSGGLWRLDSRDDKAGPGNTLGGGSPGNPLTDPSSGAAPASIGDTGPGGPSRATPDAGQPAAGVSQAVLRCAGSVEFLFASNELILRDRVRLEHQVDRTIDVFACEKLKLQFADLFKPPRRAGVPASGLATQPTSPPKREEIGDFLVSMLAEGEPAIMQMPSFGAEVSAEKIEFDARAGLLRMTGSAGARISYAGNTWRFMQVAYQLNPNDPTQIGAFDAQGSGLVEFSGDPTLPIKRLRWTDGIKLDQPDAQGEFGLRIDGNVTALMNDDGEFSCDSALLVLQAGGKHLTGQDWLRSTRPKRFQATGHVNMRSSMVEVATRLLRVYFEFGPETDGLSQPVRQEGSATAEHPIRRWVRQPWNRGDSKSPGGVGQTVASTTPVVGPRPTIHGDTINAKLNLAGGNLTTTDLTVVGNVSLKHTIDTPSGPLPTVLTGEQLQLRDTEGDEILQIGSGLDSPAKLKVGDGYFIGPLIQVRLADNIVWIRDAGEFQVPTQMLPQMVSDTPLLQPLGETAPPTRGAVAKPTNIRWVSAPRCRWRGQMLFDGSKIALTGGIDVRGAVLVGDEPELWDIDLVGDQLQVVLKQNLPMRQFDAIKSAAIDVVGVLSSSERPLVITANQLTETGIRKARHVLTTPELTFRPETSTVVGIGPGWYRAWMQTEQLPLASVVTSDGFRPADESLVGLHLAFRDSLQANVSNQSLEFVGNVRIASRPVVGWDDRIDAEQVEGLRLGESTLDCERLRLGIDPNRSRRLISTAWEMEATGRVIFQTRNDKGLFSGQAQRASYTAAKDVFLIEGEPGYGATLNQTLPTGAAGMNVAVKRMSVNTRTMEVLSVEFERLQLGTLPGLSR